MTTFIRSILVVAAFAATASADDAATIKVFKAQCATCHDVDGKGHTTAGKKLNVKDGTMARRSTR
jgi:cytochrome c2